MKKIIAMITCFIILICMLVIPEPIEVHAEESEESYSYYMKGFLCSNIDKQYGSFYNYINVEFTIDKQICGYFSCDGYTSYLYMCIYDDTGVLYGPTSFLTNLRNNYNCIFSSSLQIEGKGKYLGDNNYKFSSKSYEGELGSLFEINSRGTSFEENGFLSTNIPYFASKEECMAYINGEIDVGSALNFNSDLLQTITDSNEVPAPKNLRIEYDSKTSSFFLMWEYNPEDLEKLNLIAVTGIDKELEVRHLREDYLSWNVDFDVSLDEYLQPQLSYKIDITNDVARLRNAIVDSLSGSIEYRVKLDYWVMGSWNKSSTELHIGKVFHVELLLDSSDKGFVVNTNNYVTDKDMNVLDDLIYDNNLDFDSNFSSSDFLGNITSGFNLLGSNGLIPLLTSTLSFIPSPLWAIIGAGLSLMVIIALFKLIIK